MTDLRLIKLAKLMVDYSVRVKAQDKVLISANPDAWPLAKQIYQLCLQKNAFPHLTYQPDDLDFLFFKHARRTHLTRKPDIALYLANWADKFIRLFSEKNNRSLANINPKNLLMRDKTHQPVKDIMLQKPWVFTQFPSQSLAQSASISLEEMENIYFRACLQDWSKISRQLKKLKTKLDNAKKVEIIGNKTQLQLSFTGRFFQVADGHYNLPDGEVFGAPLDTSANGHIFFDQPSLRSGKLVEGVYLVFKQGKVVKAKADKGNQYLQTALKIDAGARRLGEFALGTNYDLKQTFLNTLFDEKIGGTIHLALGSAYPEKEGGGTNKSAIHWDLIKTMKTKQSQVLVNSKPILHQAKLLV